MQSHPLRRFWFVAVLVAILVVPTVARAAGDPVPVTVFRPARVGDADAVEVTFAQHSHEVRTVRGQPPTTHDHDWTVHLVGRRTVEAVDGRGVVTRYRCEVTKAVNGVDGNKSQLIQVGTVIEVTNPAGTVELARADHEPLRPAEVRALRQVLGVRPPAAPTVDDLFPAGGPRAIGDTWPLDVARFAEFERAAHQPSAKHVSGYATLVRLDRAAGASVLAVRQTVEQSGAAIPTTRPGATQTLDHDATTYTDTLPVGPGAHGHNTDMTSTTDYDLHATTTDGVPSDVTTRYTTQKHWATTEVPR